MTDLPRLSYTVEEAAQILGVSTWTTYRLVERGDLAKIPHLGRAVRIARVELERFSNEGVKGEVA